ncbi:uncharacterized protein LOC123030285, partial [Varanus komodoensis]|uniref:uncharacterized protein LOC123030285 n=1 Tax=Varanus komodoensis TaxID=61221 RepID=UPI001CF78B6F
MARRSLLVLPLILLLPPGCGSDSSPSIFRTVYTAVSEPGPGLPQFTAAAYVDDLPIAHYDSDTGKVWNRAKWMEKLLEVHPEYQAKYEKMLQRDKADFTAGLGAVQATHNQSAGFHTWQMMAGCEENNGKPRGRYLRFGYDGRDFLSLDVETFNWTAADAMAQITKRNWEANPSVTQRFRDYVEETCAEWIQAELVHGKERLQRRNPPEIKVTQKEVHGGLETLICVARGFYPKEIDMAWTRDGKVWVQNTSHGFLTPFTESTYYYWLGIKISSKDRMHYQCRVKHDGLQNTLDKAWNEFEDSSPSVFHTIYTAVSEPGPVLPQFMAVVFVGDLPIARYDSNSRKVWYEAKWMEKLLEVHHEYQRKYEEMLQRDGADFTAGLRAVQATHNQSADTYTLAGLRCELGEDGTEHGHPSAATDSWGSLSGSHTWQMRAGCEVGPDRRKGQYLQFGYDGRDFLSLEVETSHWMAADATAQVIQRSWEESQYITTRFKSYVGETCSQWLRAERDQVREGSQRRAPPLMKVTRRAAYENLEIFVCRAYGFYPREIYMRWTIDGEAWEEDSFRWVLGPNSDGTYYARLDIRVDTWNRQHVRCHVQHSLLQGPQDLVLEEPGGLGSPLSAPLSPLTGSPRSVFRTTYTAVSEPGPGLPQFTAAAYVDDLPIARYDSNTRALQSQTSWVKKMLELHPEYQVNYTQQLQQDEADFIAGLRAVQATHNQSAGWHTWQMMAGCE